MAIVAADLSRYCDLTVYADSIWVSGVCLGLGMVFMGANTGRDVRTPEDDEKLKKLEEKLVELKFVTTPKLEVLLLLVSASPRRTARSGPATSPRS